MGFDAITRLCLKEAFDDVMAFHSISRDEDLLTLLFECDTRGRLFVYDDAEIGHTVYVNDTYGLGRDKVFEVINKTHKEVFLWHIDGVMYNKTTKCDCAILTVDEMAFIEFKTNASNHSIRDIFENYHKAGEQLQIIVLDVKTRCAKVGINIVSLIPVTAHAVLNPTVPSDNATKKIISAKFLINTGVRLFFDNKLDLK